MATIERPGVALDPEEAETRAIHDLIDFTGRDVLEIGCGEGRLTRRFAGGAGSALAVDLDVESIALASAQLPPESLRSAVTFQVADITAMEFPAPAFDVAILSWSL
jgi:ubiquinone/menaquinone biosynthesis C-methylase UbiE